MLCGKKLMVTFICTKCKVNPPVSVSYASRDNDRKRLCYCHFHKKQCHCIKVWLLFEDFKTVYSLAHVNFPFSRKFSRKISPFFRCPCCSCLFILIYLQHSDNFLPIYILIIFCVINTWHYLNKYTTRAFVGLWKHRRNNTLLHPATNEWLIQHFPSTFSLLNFPEVPY